MLQNKTFYFIINPEGGGGKALNSWMRLKQLLLKNEINFEFIETKAKGDGTKAAIAAINKGFTHLIAVGGDGTAHEVANGMLSLFRENSQLDIAMSLYSCGTGNDWVKTHKISRDPQVFISNLLQLKYTTQDVGLVNYYSEGLSKTCYMINVAGLAYDAFVAKRCENRKKSIWTGKFYLFYVFKLLFQYNPEKAWIKVDDHEWEDQVYTINIGKCPYSGGNMQLVPHAVPDDRKLAVTIASSLPKLEVIMQTPKFYNGKIGEHPRIKTMHAKVVEIQSRDDKEILLEVDGEFLGTTPVKIEIIEKALKIFGAN